MKKTTNYQLNQWAKSDRVMMDDFNADNAKIDAALKANADAIAETAAAFPLVKIKEVTLGADTAQWDIDVSDINFYQYTRIFLLPKLTGSSNPKTLTFDGTPLFVALSGRYHFFAVKGCSFVQTLSSPSLADLSLPLTWGDRSVSWYSTENADKQQNLSGTDYFYIALLAAD